MSKALSLMTLLLFLVATSLAPYLSSKHAQLMTSSSEESSLSTDTFEEEIHHQKHSALVIIPTGFQDLSFPQHQSLKPQYISSPDLRPPLA